MASPFGEIAPERVAVAQRQLVAWRNDPVLFARQVLGVKEMWSRQIEMLRALAHHRRVAVRSGQKTSKSFNLAILALWWIATRLKGVVYITSAGETQIKETIWPELRLINERAPVALGGKLADDPRTGWKFSGGRKIIGLVAKEPERMQGFSGPEVLWLPDEGSGIADPIFEAMDGNMGADGCKMLMPGNPTKTSGYFYDAFHSQKAIWHCIHIRSTETPNIVQGRDVIPGLAGPIWLQERKTSWGVASAMYQVRVEGEFPTQGSNAMIPLDLVVAAEERWASTFEDGELEIGVDPAELGPDDSVFFPRRGQKALKPDVHQGLDKETLAGKLLELIDRLSPPRPDGLRQEEITVRIDDIGIGSGLAHIIEAYGFPWLKVVRVNVSHPAEVEENILGRMANIRTQVWFGLKDWLAGGGAIPPDTKLEGELVAPLYEYDTKGRLIVEDKRKLRSRIHRSPNLADALGLAIFRPANTTPTHSWKRGKVVGGRRW